MHKIYRNTESITNKGTEIYSTPTSLGTTCVPSAGTHCPTAGEANVKRRYMS